MNLIACSGNARVDKVMNDDDEDDDEDENMDDDKSKKVDLICDTSAKTKVSRYQHMHIGDAESKTRRFLQDLWSQYYRGLESK